MKRFLPIVFTVLSFVIISCGGGKSGDPTPSTTPTTPVVVTPPIVVTPPTGGTTGGSSYTYSRVDIKTIGGNGTFDASGNLMGADVSQVGGVLKTTSGGTAKVSLVHAEGGVITKYQGAWRETFSNYDATDTTKQAYLRVIDTDDTNKKITEYRGYIIGKDATLDYIASSIPATMDAATFQSKFTSSTQKVLTATH